LLKDKRNKALAKQKLFVTIQSKDIAGNRIAQREIFLKYVKHN
jgi:hypothetical protein